MSTDREWLLASYKRNMSLIQELVKSEESSPWRRVNRAALDALIEYADDKRQQSDSQFLAGRDEEERSQQEFDKLIAALDA